MERKPLVVSSVVGFLGLLSAVTGFAAEGTRIKANQVQFISSTQCHYPRSPAMALGLTSAVALMIAQLIINVLTGCVCCKRTPRPPNSNWKIALVCFVISWFSFVIAFLLLLTGAALNDQHDEQNMYFGYYYCYVVKPGVFAGGALLAIASVMLGIFYYLTLNSIKNETTLWGNPAVTAAPGGIALGQPQFPPPQYPPPQYPPPQYPQPQTTQEPVFVHEDTYMRRQFT